MAYWGGAGMNFVGGATAKDRKEFLETYDAWLRDNGRVARNVKGVYVPRAYVPKPKKDGTFRAPLTQEQRDLRLLNLEKAREAKKSGIIKPKRVKSTEKRTLSESQKAALALGRQVARDRANFMMNVPRKTYKAARKPTDVLKSRKTPAQKAARTNAAQIAHLTKLIANPGAKIRRRISDYV